MSAPIPVFSDRPKAVPTPKLRALVKFPGNVEATTGIDVTKENGTWTFELDYTQFAPLPGSIDDTTAVVLVYDTIAGVFYTTPLSAVTPPAPVPALELLTADRGYFVRRDGSDANTGLINNAAGAFKTIQKAIDVIAKTLSLGNHVVTISCAAGTYPEPITTPVGGWCGPGQVILHGDQTTPSNCLIQTANASAVTVSVDSTIVVLGFKVVTTTAGDCFSVGRGAKLYVSDLDLGTCAGTHFSLSANCLINPSGNYTISGNPVGAHIHVPEGGSFVCSPITITLSGTRAWGTYFIGLRGNCYVDLHTVTFAGSGATGGRGTIHIGAVLDMEGKPPDYIPGSAPLVIDQGGLFVCKRPSVSANASITIAISDGLFWVRDTTSGAAILSYNSQTALVEIAWQNGAGRFATTDPGSGGNKVWVQPNGVFTNRFPAPVELYVAPLTPGISS